MRLLLPVVLAALALAPAAQAQRAKPAPDGPGPKTEAVEVGNVRAELSWTERESSTLGIEWVDVRARVLRDGVERYSAAYKDLRPGGEAGSIAIEDLDGDGEQEVLVDLFSGGAHCCSETRIVSWDGQRYRSLKHRWGNHGYVLHDGVFDTLDDRFAGTFCAYAASFYPRRFFAFGASQGMYEISTRPRFAPEHRADVRALWRFVVRYRRDPCAHRSALAAWAAAKARIGQGQAALRTVRSRTDRRFAAQLRAFLKRTGYLR